MPGRDMLISSVATISAFVALGMFGLVIPAIPFYQVLLMPGFALIFIASPDLPKYVVFRRFGL